jgi:hypothetical protein
MEVPTTHPDTRWLVVGGYPTPATIYSGWGVFRE